MKPILYAQNETNFSTNGIGVLSDAISAIATEELNGAFELRITYPVSGIHYAKIGLRSLIKAKANRSAEDQLFRVYAISKPINGIVEIAAEHISYDLNGVPVAPFGAMNVAAAMGGLASHAVIPHHFSFGTDKSTVAQFQVMQPQSIRACLGGQAGSILDTYQGEFEFDNFVVFLRNKRGTNRGVSIRYGKNLIDLKQEENCQNVYTGIYPFYGSSDDSSFFDLPEKVVNAEGAFEFIRIKPVDLSDKFEEPPSEQQLREAAYAYVESNDIGIPTVSLTVSYVQLAQAEGYKNLGLFERVDLGDTVKVVFEKLGIEAEARCIKTEYNCLLDRYEKLELGSKRANLADTMAASIEKANKAPTTTAMQKAIDNATALITGNSGGYVILHSSQGQSRPDEILIMDTEDITTAQKVWRWNRSGWGYSSTGYAGPYGLAATIDGAIVADFITTGTLNAALVKAGVLQSVDGRVSINMESGVITITNNSGKTVFSFDQNGNLVMSGRLNAATGTFSGDLSAAGGTFSGDLSAAGGTFSGTLSGVDGTFSGSLTAANGTFTNLNAANGTVYFYQNYINIAGVLIGSVPGYSDICVLPSSHQYGNLGVGARAWDQCVARYLYSRNGEVSSYSMRKLKHNIKPYEIDSEAIDKLCPVTFVMNDDETERKQIGLIADDVQGIIPEIVKEFQDESMSEPVLTLEYSRLAIVLLAEVQKLRKRVYNLECELNNDKGEKNANCN